MCFRPCPAQVLAALVGVQPGRGGGSPEGENLSPTGLRF